MQTSYTQFQSEAVLGMMSEDFTKYVDTVIPQVPVKTATMLTADKTAGKVRNAAKLPSSAAEIARPGAMGIVILDATREIAPGATLDWPALRPLGVMRRGRIWVMAETDVARWTYPYVRFTGSGTIGGFRADADTANAAQLTDALFITDAQAGQLVLLEIDIF